MEPTSLRKHTFAQNVRPRCLLLFTALRGHGASQRVVKRCFKTASKNQPLFEPQKVIQKASNGSQNGSKLSSFFGSFLALLSPSWDMGYKVLPRPLRTSTSDPKVLKNALKMTLQSSTVRQTTQTNDDVSPTLLTPTSQGSCKRSHRAKQ